MNAETKRKITDQNTRNGVWAITDEIISKINELKTKYPDEIVYLKNDQEKILLTNNTNWIGSIE